ncbi:MAG TPA: M3 family metallopeptidase [Oligoflexia bacterium]|nr:M3 family metallopeptidase [Oligoflexia bacterium]HMP26793.1 M3 family metallopeptidase [Oligoflexia bacterium]
MTDKDGNSAQKGIIKAGEHYLLGCKDVRFDLSDIYADHNDPQIEADLDRYSVLTAQFAKKYKGRLVDGLGEAIVDLQRIYELASKLNLYIALQRACDLKNYEFEKKESVIFERLSRDYGAHLSFFPIEIGELPEEVLAEQIKNIPIVAKHSGFLRHIKAKRKHLLSEEVERALAVRSPFGIDEWDNLFKETESELKFRISDQRFKDHKCYESDLNITEALELINNSGNATLRAYMLKEVNDALKTKMAPISTKCFNLVAGIKNIEDSERGYANVFSARNLDNRISDGLVKSLHQAVLLKGAEINRRYYKLLSKAIGIAPLGWSDRNASILVDESKISWQEANQIVRESFLSFSPLLVELVDRMVSNRWVDAPVYAAKQSGAFNYSVVMPAPLGERSYTFLNYLGSSRDVMTFAHELGHAVHGMLAGKEQGALMSHAPIAYCETASIFAEMLTFEELLRQTDDKRRRLAMLMEKLKGFTNTVIRQISFSIFEESFHEERKKGKISQERFAELWLEATKKLYGDDGDIFKYQDMDFLWSYIRHFFSPFYVYAYAFGELLTQSLFAARARFERDKFEILYIEMLKAGGSKDLVDLLAPFDLKADDPAFWEDGIKVGAEKWMIEAENLFDELN